MRNLHSFQDSHRRTAVVSSGGSQVVGAGVGVGVVDDVAGSMIEDWCRRVAAEYRDTAGKYIPTVSS